MPSPSWQHSASALGSDSLARRGLERMAKCCARWHASPGSRGAGRKCCPASSPTAARLIEIQKLLGAAATCAEFLSDELAHMFCRIGRAATPSLPIISSTSPILFSEHEVQCLPLEEGVYDRVPATGDEHQGQNTGLRTRRAGALPDLVEWPRSDDRFFAQEPRSTMAT